MKKLNFYHQKRRDGGIRTGVMLNGIRELELFKPGKMELNPALEWFVDMRWQGRHLPNTTDDICDWLLERSPVIQTCLQEMAGELSAGIDSDRPFVKDLPTSADGSSGKIVCSAVRLLEGREIGQVLLKLKKAWPDLIVSLPAYGAQVAA